MGGLPTTLRLTLQSRKKNSSLIPARKREKATMARRTFFLFFFFSALWQSSCLFRSAGVWARRARASARRKEATLSCARDRPPPRALLEKHRHHALPPACSTVSVPGDPWIRSSSDTSSTRCTVRPSKAGSWGAASEGKKRTSDVAFLEWGRAKKRKSRQLPRRRSRSLCLARSCLFAQRARESFIV